MWVAQLAIWVILCNAIASTASRPSKLAYLPGGHYWESNTDPSQVHDKTTVRKIAIIGAGPSGSSAAYFLRKAQDRLTSSSVRERIDITIYERNQRIGGRAAVVYPHDDEQYEPVELGASIYADVNLNLRRAVKEFNLEAGAQNGESGQMGVWDGQQFLFIGDASSWWTSAKFFLRYGYSALTAQNLVSKQLGLFSRLYEPSFLHKSSNSANRFPWATIEDFAEAVNASSLAATTGLDYFKEHRVSDLFIEEMIEAATRVNYAQDTDQIHGFGALVSLAASGATGVKDGNYRIFEEFVQRSSATVLKGSQGEVTGIVKFNRVQRPGTYEHHEGPQWYVGTKSGEGETYDAVIIATPWHNADITLLNTESRVRAKAFVHLHVTLLTTTASGADPRYFGLGVQDSVPRTILTSDESIRRAIREKERGNQTICKDESADDNGNCKPDVKRSSSKKQPKMDFFSLNYLRPLRPRQSSLEQGEETKEYVVKIFSHEVMTDELLDRLFGLSTITWIKRHEWDSYPLLTPTTRFPHIQVDENLYYSNAMESLVSTMETSTISARNTVGLLLRKWYGDSFVNGRNCNYSASDDAQDPMKNANWAGWGCQSG